MTMADVLINSNTMLSYKEQEKKLFTQVQANRNLCKLFMTQIIESSLVIISQQIGLQIPCDKTQTTFRSCVTFRDVVLGIKNIIDFTTKAAALHFLTVFWRDTLYSNILTTTHQFEAEKAFIAMHNIRIVYLHMLTARQKTCIGSMYGECFNDVKQKLNRSIFAKDGLSVSVILKYIFQNKHYKRDKQIFYINDKKMKYRHR